MKKILLVVCLGMFLGAASVSAESITAHKAVRTEQKAHKSATQKKAHKKAHKKGHKKGMTTTASNSSINKK